MDLYRNSYMKWYMDSHMEIHIGMGTWITIWKSPGKAWVHG